MELVPKHPMLCVALSGLTGRMGTEIERHLNAAGFRVVGRRTSRGWELSDEVPNVVIDFSTPEGAEASLEFALDRTIPYVTGTTGFGAGFESALERAATAIPLLQSGNMSVGIAILQEAVERISSQLPLNFDPEVLETHHRRKVDAPSGTAKMLVASIVAGRSRHGKHHETIYDRTNRRACRGDEEIGVSVLRGGDVVGEHTVLFLGDGERIEISHRATSRSIFAAGAVAAASWIMQQRVGRYRMSDVIRPMDRND